MDDAPLDPTLLPASELALERGCLLLIGHGQMNGLIGKRLCHAGWRGPWLRPRRYWAFAVYERT